MCHSTIAYALGKPYNSSITALLTTVNKEKNNKNNARMKKKMLKKLWASKDPKRVYKNGTPGRHTHHIGPTLNWSQGGAQTELVQFWPLRNKENGARTGLKQS